jgi:hypothetical protein
VFLLIKGHLHEQNQHLMKYNIVAMTSSDLSVFAGIRSSINSRLRSITKSAHEEPDIRW